MSLLLHLFESEIRQSRKRTDLRKGLKKEDYEISIGIGRCAVADLLGIAITCEPPSHEPKVNKTGPS